KVQHREDEKERVQPGQILRFPDADHDEEGPGRNHELDVEEEDLVEADEAQRRVPGHGYEAHEHEGQHHGGQLAELDPVPGPDEAVGQVEADDGKAEDVSEAEDGPQGEPVALVQEEGAEEEIDIAKVADVQRLEDKSEGGNQGNPS